MKRMKSRIAITFVIIFVVGVLINGLNNIISLKKNLVTFDALVGAMQMALFYLMYIWMYTRKNQRLVFVGAIGVLIFLIFFVYAAGAEDELISSLNFFDFINLIYYIIAASIANYQANQLLLEDDISDSLK